MNRFASIAWLVLMVSASISGGANAVDNGEPSRIPGGTPRFEGALSPENAAVEALLNTASDNGSTVESHQSTERSAMADKTRKAVGGSTVFGTLVNNQGQSLCGLVLANGQYMFSCAPVGSYSLDVPLDGNGQITLFAFVDGHFPFKVVLNGSGGRYDIRANVANVTPPIVIDPPPPTSTVTFNITDACNDGFRIDYKFFDETNNLVWPSSSTHYFTNFYNTTYTHSLSCSTGAKICFGGETGTRYWGVDVDDSKSCTDCCIICATGASWSRQLTCN